MPSASRPRHARHSSEGSADQEVSEAEEVPRTQSQDDERGLELAPVGRMPMPQPLATFGGASSSFGDGPSGSAMLNQLSQFGMQAMKLVEERGRQREREVDLIGRVWNDVSGAITQHVSGNQKAALALEEQAMSAHERQRKGEQRRRRRLRERQDRAAEREAACEAASPSQHARQRSAGTIRASSSERARQPPRERSHEFRRQEDEAQPARERSHRRQEDEARSERSRSHHRVRVRVRRRRRERRSADSRLPVELTLVPGPNAPAHQDSRNSEDAPSRTPIPRRNPRTNLHGRMQDRQLEALPPPPPPPPPPPAQAALGTSGSVWSKSGGVGGAVATKASWCFKSGQAAPTPKEAAPKAASVSAVAFESAKRAARAALARAAPGGAPNVAQAIPPLASFIRREGGVDGPPWPRPRTPPRTPSSSSDS